MNPVIRNANQARRPLPIFLGLLCAFAFGGRAVWRLVRPPETPPPLPMPEVVRTQSAWEPRRTFHLSPDGDDRRSGLSPGDAWKTLERASREVYRPGDRLRLRAGGRYAGTLSFGPEEQGTPFRPIVVEVWGTGRATIVAGDGPAVSIRDTAGIRISGLDLVGSGAANRAAGVVVENGLPGDRRLTHLVLRDLDVGGFGREGIRIFGVRGRSGFSDVRIEDCRTHDNVLAGIYVGATFEPHRPEYAHADVTVRGCSAVRHPGDPEAKVHTGSGIVVSEAEGALVDRCEASQNGGRSVSKDGGPVGIWGWHCDRLVIQRCVSHHNRTGGRKDGGGFDLDGGCTNSVMQGNLSYGNDGAGYLVAQFPGARPFYNNVVRHNVSIDDGRRNGYGGIMAWAQVAQTQIVHNTVVMTRTDEGTVCGVLLREVEALNLDFANNLICVGSGVPAVRCDMSRQPGSIRFTGNLYVSPEVPRFEWQGRVAAGIGAWRSQFGQERIDRRDVGGEERAPVAAASGSGAPRPNAFPPSVAAGRRRVAVDLRETYGVDMDPAPVGAGSVPRQRP